MMRILNLYAGIGGNRKLWEGVEVTAIEINPKIAEIYQKHFPHDKVIVADAHQFLLDHYKEFDFIWSSPPCPTHSKIGMLAMKYYEQIKESGEKPKAGIKKPTYPDMRLYEEILFLQNFFSGKWVIENTISYYEPLVRPFISGNHYFWSNFHISRYNLSESRAVSISGIKNKERKVGFDLTDMDLGHRKDQILNNCVEPKLGLFVFNCAFKDKQKTLINLNGENK
jgi:DNA (cytosine-5)-methyltransferase 1